jgi:hypothetical protein
MKRFLMITTASALLCGHAFAQQAAVMPTPSLSATSPLGMVPSAPVGGTGIPFGATEITSPGVSPASLPSTGIIGSTVCSTVGTAPSTMFGSAASFDGGGMPFGVILVGALNVGSMTTVWHGDVTPRKHREVTALPVRDEFGPITTAPLALEKGDEMARFNMGSTVILLLPPGAVAWSPTLVSGQTLRLGERIGTLRDWQG